MKGDALTRVIAALEASGSRHRGNDWQCPSHEDRAPSLSVAQGDEGAVLHCQAGCRPDDVCAALGLELADLFDERGDDASRIAATYPYVDEQGNLLFEAVRFEPKAFRQRRPDGRGGWIWNLNGTRRVLYRLPDVLAAVEQGKLVVLVEGEKDADLLVSRGLAASTNPMGAGKWRQEYAQVLAGAKVAVIVDRDEAGRRHGLDVYRSLEGVTGAVQVFEPAEGKDVSDHLAAGRAIDQLVKVDPFTLAPTSEEPTAARPERPLVRFVSLLEYVAQAKGSPEALLGDAALSEVLLPVAGLLMVYGDAGSGKSTLNVDAVAHLASGTDWLGFKVARPIKVALIQNEGPAEPWRRKLERKLETWEGDTWQDNVLVLDEPHGGFDFRLAEHREAIMALREQGVELVIGDPTKWLGFEGGGTPDEVRDFVALLKECGLHATEPERALAFWLAHHENVRGEVSGAWRADPDTVVHVELDGRERTKLTWDKCRWASTLHGERALLAWKVETAGFETIELPEGPKLSDDELDEQVLAWLVENPGKHSTTKVRQAIPARSERVDEALERLKKRDDCLDLDRRDVPHDGRPRTPRYWIASVHAGLQSSLTLGTTPDDFPSGSPDPLGVVPSSRHRGGTTLGRDDFADVVEGVA